MQSFCQAIHEVEIRHDRHHIVHAGVGQAVPAQPLDGLTRDRGRLNGQRDRHIREGSPARRQDGTARISGDGIDQGIILRELTERPSVMVQSIVTAVHGRHDRRQHLPLRA